MTALPPYQRFSSQPAAQGLYNPAHDRDACGLAMVATLRGTAGHDIVEKALEALRNLEHRGAVGSDAGTGDGAGIITQIPHSFFSEVTGFELPAKGSYAVGAAFLPSDVAARETEKAGIERIATEEGLQVLGWREVPVNPDVVGDLAREAMPHFEQLFVASALQDEKQQPLKGIDLDRQTFRARKRCERELGSYFPSLSCRTMVYKGMVTTLQLEPFYPDLSDERFVSTLALVHSRYSTNTFPSWPLAQPFRMIAHNGEINTIRANRNWMRARQSQLNSPVLGDLPPLFPIVTEGGSDSASFDEVVELLTLAGRSLPHAVMMMVPEAWENQVDMDPAVRDFYE
ncbi:MAG: glutamate synthase subunit alpha, partial [Microbacteriaceae bacterium]|nr:glutamate synthase subunit alpha [Microbacteriaceae bacterium]